MKKWLKIALYFLSCAVVLWLIGRIVYKKMPADPHAVRNQPEVLNQAAISGPNANRDLVLKDFSWQKAGDGSVGFHSFTIYNASKQYAYTAITVRFSYYSELGDEVGHTDKTINKSIKVGETVRIDKLEIGLINQHGDGADMEILK